MTDDKITPIPVKNKQLIDKGLFLVPPKRSACDHKYQQYTVNVVHQKCWCAKCGEEISPYFVLQQLMQAESRWMQSRERYADEMARLQKRSKTQCIHCKKLTPISRN